MLTDPIHRGHSGPISLIELLHGKLEIVVEVGVEYIRVPTREQVVDPIEWMELEDYLEFLDYLSLIQDMQCLGAKYTQATRRLFKEN